MLFTLPNVRLNRPKVLGAVIIGTIVAGSVVASHPAAYAAALATVQSAVSCATTSACVAGTNTTSGPGVSGTSSSGYGVYGVSKSNDGVKAVSTSSNGVSASSTSAIGVKGESSSSYGVYGLSTSGTAAIFGTSSGSSDGVDGQSANGNGLYGTASGGGIGVGGYSFNGDGALGESINGTGVYGVSQSDTSPGIYGTNTGGTGGVGVFAYSAYTPALYANSEASYGVQAHTSSGTDALKAANDGGNGSDIQGTYIGMIGRAPASGGFPLVLTDPSGHNLFYVDGAGNVHYSGQLEPFSAASGSAVQSYTAKTTEPVVEDSGTAQLSAGSASVVLDPTFAASIDMRTPYKVFITPDGDTHGLFVALKTVRGFIVRESQGGRSSVTFDYRILASAQGQAGKRMSALSLVSSPHAPVTAFKQYAAPALPTRLLKK